MGHDIQPISRHNLDVSSVEALAEDLAERFKINIDYGFINLNQEVTLLLDPKFTDNNYISLGKVQSNEYNGLATLFDENYVDRELYEKYGDTIRNFPEYKKYYDRTNMKKKYNTIYKFPIYTFYQEKIGDLRSFSIYKQSIENGLFYFSRWWEFCRAILEDSFDDNYKALNEYRRMLMHFALKTGGDKIIYLDDQGATMEWYDLGVEGGMTWEEIEETLIKEIGPSIINIPDIVTNSIERTPYMDYNEYSLVFVDDFRDLPGLDNNQHLYNKKS